MSNTVNKIKSLATKAADERLSTERQQIESRVNKDLEIIEKILGMVKDRLIYKESRDYGSKKYVVVTEEIVLKDYTTKPEGYSSGGTSIEQVEGSFWNVRHTKISVNGHTYYHAQDIFKRYEWQISKAIENSDKEREIIKQKEEALKEMKELEPVVKQILLNYQQHLEPKVEER